MYTLVTLFDTSAKLIPEMADFRAAKINRFHSRFACEFFQKLSVLDFLTYFLPKSNLPYLATMHFSNLFTKNKEMSYGSWRSSIDRF